MVNVIDASDRGHERGRQRGGSDLRGPPPGPDQDRGQDRAAADPVDPPDAAHRGSQDDQHGSRDQPGRAAGIVLGSGPGQGQPDTERDQDGGDHQVEDPRAGQQLDADDRSGDDAGHGSGDEHQGEAAAGLSLPPVPVQRAGRGDHVVQQVGRGDRRAGRAQHADLKGQQQHRTRDPRRAWPAPRCRTRPPARRPQSSRSRALSNRIKLRAWITCQGQNANNPSAPQ